MDNRHDTAIEAVLEQLIEHGPEGVAAVFARTFEMAMRTWRERFLGARTTSARPTGGAMPMATSPSGSIRRRAR